MEIMDENKYNVVTACIFSSVCIKTEFNLFYNEI